VGELCLGRVPDLDGVGVFADQVLEVDRQGAAVALEAGAGGVDSLGDVEDDRGEAVLVDVDFLVVRDLADGAGSQGSVAWSVNQRAGASGVLQKKALALDENVPHVGEVVGEFAFQRPAEEADLLVAAAGHGELLEERNWCAIWRLGF
jgi:hypothetical protein